MEEGAEGSFLFHLWAEAEAEFWEDEFGFQGFVRRNPSIPVARLIPSFRGPMSPKLLFMPQLNSCVKAGLPWWWHGAPWVWAPGVFSRSATIGPVCTGSRHHSDLKGACYGCPYSSVWVYLYPYTVDQFPERLDDQRLKADLPPESLQRNVPALPASTEKGDRQVKFGIRRHSFSYWRRYGRQSWCKRCR